MSTQTKGQHTPGPWWVVPDDIRQPDYSALVATAIGTYSVDCTRSGKDKYEDAANARLIAAAPDLLAALEFAHDALNGYGDPDGKVLEKVRAAIAKARGEGQ